MKYKTRLLGLITIDSLIVVVSMYLCHFILNPYVTNIDSMIVVSSILLLVSHHLFSYLLGLYKRVWRFASIEELFSIVMVVVSSIIVVMAAEFIIFGQVYERALVATLMMQILLIGGVRFARRYISTYRFSLKPILKKEGVKEGKRTLIIGAGSAGRMLLRQLKDNEESGLNPIAILDDNESLHHLKVQNISVEGSTKQIQKVVHERRIEHIVIAMPSVSRQKIGDIVKEAKEVCSNVQILPMIEDLALGNKSVNHIRDVSIEDLLGREPVQLDITNISKKVKGQTVVVTGAGGSIGSELCRQLAKFDPKEIVLVGHGENSIYTIEMELRTKFPSITFPTEIADIQDRHRMFEVMLEHEPQFVFHAAAHKHVPLMERNSSEAVKNNVLGTKNVAEAADASGVDTFVLVSSDKAVNPTNVMGSTKRLAEMVIQELSRKSKTRFVAVRFGNVLGSRGSVVPLFKRQIANGGPVTVTHPDMTRYFMTIPEAARLVIQAGSLARGGEIFVLDMGEPVRIVDLAKNLIRLSGLSEDEIPIQYSGIRPGEKMYEELLNDNEVHPEQVFPKIYIGKADSSHSIVLNEFLNSFKLMDEQSLRTMVLDIANNRYKPKKKDKYRETVNQ
ncbi:nucleoside-diphosphate sugar epimerase/dehydratase [Bacillus tianshenii]|nr:nucleoside-diphosphate sugar epimerase/dehydratase [Bacillus tianshenii]